MTESGPPVGASVFPYCTIYSTTLFSSSSTTRIGVAFLTGLPLGLRLFSGLLGLSNSVRALRASFSASIRRLFSVSIRELACAKRVLICTTCFLSDSTSSFCFGGSGGTWFCQNTRWFKNGPKALPVVSLRAVPQVHLLLRTPFEQPQPFSSSTRTLRPPPRRPR